MRLSLLKYGYIILIVQNVLNFGYLFLRDPYTYYYYFLVFHLDLIGFGMIAIGYCSYLKTDLKGKRAYVVGGFLFACWVIFRVLNQYVIPLIYDFSAFYSLYDSSVSFFIIPCIYSLIRVDFLGGFVKPLPPLGMVLIYVVNAFVLLLAFFFCEQYQYFNFKVNRSFSQLFSFVYPFINLIAVLIHSFPFLDTILLGAYFHDGISSTGLFLKMSLVPLLGIIVFILMIGRIILLSSSNKT